jgi:DNA-binding transcriptional ArsR family regulator
MNDKEAVLPEHHETPPPVAPTSTLHLDATAVKVLAHPLRSRLLGALRSGGPATATALAEKLDTNTGATSYHLRKLATVGLVEEATGGHGRERWWRAASAMHAFTQRDVAYDADGEAAADWLRRFYLRSFVDRYQGWLDVHASWPFPWQEAADASDYLLRLSPSRLQELQSELSALVARYRDPDPDDREAQAIEVDFHAFPTEKAPR